VKRDYLDIGKMQKFRVDHDEKEMTRSASIK
jgi:hypothetical protein